jgi:hypothetical protein
MFFVQFAVLAPSVSSAKPRPRAASSTSCILFAERKEPRDTFVLVRGVWDKHRRARTAPDVPGALAPWPQDEPRTRLGLARWLTSKQNPWPRAWP